MQGARIVALVGQREAAGVPQHMRMSLEAEPGSLAGALDMRAKPAVVNGAAALGGEHERRLGILLALQPAQRPQLVAEIGCVAGVPCFDPADVPGVA